MNYCPANPCVVCERSAAADREPSRSYIRDKPAATP